LEYRLLKQLYEVKTIEIELVKEACFSKIEKEKL
jgi:hypothetical protein